MNLRKTINYFIVAVVATLMTIPCMADIKGTAILQRGVVPEKITVMVSKHILESSSSFKGAYTFDGGTFVIPTKKNKDYRFETRGKKEGVEYYTEVAQIPYKTEKPLS